ncbi:MAG: beta strand repeat-containing protein, partial [Parasphingopyxis sp.]|uniref:beta strand repeat-containing protein n=1 Tax=Parasphingopyxis sp. TaxID=1920299 RepID=UPI003FA08A1E
MAAILAGMTALPAPVYAQTADSLGTIFWDGGNSTDWFDGGNWSDPIGGPRVPNALDNAVIEIGGADAPIVEGATTAQANAVIIGEADSGALTVRNGGRIVMNFGRLGERAGSSGTLLVTGADSYFGFQETLVIGNLGSGNATVADGAMLEGTTTFIGDEGTGELTITGADSHLRTLQIQTGNSGTGTLLVEDGGLAEAEVNFVGSDAGGEGTVTVRGAGSRVRSTQQTNVGRNGTGRVIVENGGLFLAQQAAFGIEQGGFGSLMVDGPGSLFEAAATRIGDAGEGAVTLANGGAMTAFDITIGAVDGSDGMVTIESGGRLTSQLTTFGRDAGSTGSALLTGAGSEWLSEFQTIIGDAGTATVEIRDGAIFRQGLTRSSDRDDNSAIGLQEGSNGSVLISGPGSAWISERQELFNVGKAGTGTLVIENGGLMQVRAMAIGSTSTGVGTVIVDGPGSHLQIDRSSFYVGVNNLRIFNNGGFDEPDGGDGTLTIRNGGRVSGAFVFLIGSNVDGAAGGLVTVTGRGSLLETEGVAFFSLGRLEVLDGGLYESTGFYFQNPGSRALVDGSGSLIRVLSGAEVDGQLVVSNGAVFEARRLGIGEFCEPSSILCDETDILRDPFVRVDGANSEIILSGTEFETTTRTFLGPLFLSNGGRLVIGDRFVKAPAGSLFADRVVFEGTGSAIRFNHTDSDFLFPMPISGNGAVEVRGGTTRLTGTSSYTGPTTVTDASLIVDGRLGDTAVSVEGFSLLGGSGAIGGDLTLSRGAVLSPGGLLGSERGESLIGTLATGSLTLDSSTLVQIDVNDQGQGDRIDVTGTVDLGGATLSVSEIAGDFSGTNPFVYTIIGNDGSDVITGTFGSILNRLAFLTPSVDYMGGDGNDAILSLTPNNAVGGSGCFIDGNTMICEGALPGGVAVDDGDGVDRLVVRNLTEQIAPPSGTNGLSFIRAANPVAIVTQPDGFGISATGEASAIYAESRASRIVVDNSMALSATAPTGYNVSGIRVLNRESTAPANQRNPGTVEITNSAPITVVAGQGSGFDFNVVASGIQSRMFAEGTTRITNTGTITITETDDVATTTNAAAIFAQSFASDNATHVINEGDIILNGRHLAGIDILGMDVQSRGGSNVITLVNRGGITGFGSIGIDVSGTAIENFVTSNVRVENYAPITLAVGDSAGRSGGISLNDNAGGEYVFVNEGDIRITDSTGTVSDTDFTGAGGYGIFVSVGDTFSRVIGNSEIASVLTFENSGNIYAEGDGGIRAQARVFDVTNSGNIETRGLFADGLYAFQGALELFGNEFGGDIDLDASLDNSGDITVSGDFATALGVEFTGNGDFDNSGALTANGDGGAGLFLASFTDAFAFNTGAITATGDDAFAVLIADFTVDPDTYDVVARNYDAERDLNSAITFFTDADITATGANSDGIRAELGTRIFGSPDASFFDDYAASATIFVGEDVTVSGGSGTGAGVRFEGRGGGILFNEGTVTALSGAAVIGGEGDDTVENAGTIAGSVALGDGDDTINYAAAGIFTGPVDGEEGEDRIVIDVFDGQSTTFDFATTDFRSFERLFKRGEGMATLTGDGSAFDAVFTVEGGTLFADTMSPTIDFIVARDTVLRGMGSLGGLSVTGGTVSPGSFDMGTSGIGTFTLNGDLSLDAQSVFAVDVDDMGNADTLIVNGGVSLGSATLAVTEIGTFDSADPFTYTIIDNDGTDGVEGIFGTITNQLAFLTPTVSYASGDGNDVVLTLMPNAVVEDGCRIDGNRMICSGLLPDGVDVREESSLPNLRELLVTQITGRIDGQAADGIAIDFTNDDAPVTINVDTPGTVITSQAARFDRPGFRVDAAAAIGVRGQSSRSVSITSNADIVIDASPVDRSVLDFTAGIAADFLPVGDTRQSGTIVNTGSITITDDGLGDGTLSMVGIFAGFSYINAFLPVPDRVNIDRVEIRNLGEIDVTTGNGIVADTLHGGELEIVNSGSIRVTTTDATLNSHGIQVRDSDAAQLLTIVNDGTILTDDPVSESAYAIQVEKALALEGNNPATIINNGIIRELSGDADNFSTGIELGTPTFSPFPSAALGQGRAADMPGATFTIINNGMVDVVNRGIEVLSSGNRVIENYGTVNVAANKSFEAAVAFNFNSPSRGPREHNPIGNLTRFINGPDATITIDAGDTGSSNTHGVLFLGGDPDIQNDGRITVIADQSAGIIASEGFQQTGTILENRFAIGAVDLRNSGVVEVTGDETVGVIVSRLFISEEDIFDTNIVSSGDIIADGVNADGIRLQSFGWDFGDGPVFENRGQSSIILEEGSIVRGGSGTGAAIRLTNGERNTIDNVGLIEADSGAAIVGGIAIEDVTNSGVINGTVALGANDDIFTLVAGGSVGETIDGGDDEDSFVLSAAADASATFDFAATELIGFERFFKRGDGGWQLIGDGSGLGGVFAVEAGLLAVDGDLSATRFTVQSGGVLGGSGTVGSVNLVGGTLSPGAGGAAPGRGAAPDATPVAVVSVATSSAPNAQNAEVAPAATAAVDAEISTPEAVVRSTGGRGEMFAEEAPHAAGPDFAEEAPHVSGPDFAEEAPHRPDFAEEGPHTPDFAEEAPHGPDFAENIPHSPAPEFAEEQPHAAIGPAGERPLAGGIGTLTIDGDLTMDADSIFEVEVDDVGNADRVIVNGLVDLGGSTLSVLEIGDFMGDDPFNYLIIANDGSDAITGAFGALVNQFAFLTPSVDYAAGDGNDAELTLTPNNAPPPPPPP